MGQPIAVLGLLVAVLGAALRWELPSRPAPQPAPAVLAAQGDRAIQAGITTLRTKPRVTNKIKVRKIAVDQDNSNSSYAALGLRASCVPDGLPSWLHRAGTRVESLNRSFTWSLKVWARKSILGRVT